jgi:hypothetical protein
MKKNSKSKKVLGISLVVFDVILTIFLFVISLIMLIKTNKMTQAELVSDANTGFIAYLQKNPTFYLCLFVIPLFVLLAANIIGLVLYTKKVTKSAPVHVQELSAEQKEALLSEMLKEQKEKADKENQKKD